MKHASTLFLGLFLLVMTAFNGCEPYTGSTVRVLKGDQGAYRLEVNGKDFYVYGAGWNKYMADVKPAGGNVIRTWGAENLGDELDEALANGVMVIAGLWVPHERHGYNYNSEKKVKRTMEEFREVVTKYKDHPALLMWGVGNEYNINWRNEKVWTFVNEVAKMIKEVDGHHPTVSVLASYGKDDLILLRDKAPEVDILGVNAYGGLQKFLPLMRENWTKPYIVTEWGHQGYWEVGKTSWDAPYEPSSGEKADQIRQNYAAFSPDKACLGSCIFLWGWKQERTHTFFNLYLPDGRTVETRETISALWTRQAPAKPSVRVEKLLPVVDESGDVNDEVIINLGESRQFQVSIVVPAGTQASFEWDIYEESAATSGGGDFEKQLPKAEGMIVEGQEGDTVLVQPNRTGRFRLFVYVTNDNGVFGNANIPFLVE